MKTLHIVRHGKALQDYQALQDYDRPLIEKGIVNNIFIAKQLREVHASPGLIISSFAARALHTAHIFAQVMKYPHERVQVNANLYLEGDEEIFNILERLPDELEIVMIVGHNPDVTSMAIAYGCVTVSIPTSGVVSICFKADRWNEINKSNVVQTQKFFIEK